MKVKLIALAVSTLTMSGAWAHGYLIDPPSRAHQCQKGKNQSCGDKSNYEPQSLEQKTGYFDKASTQTGKLASAGLPGYYELDRQSIDSWYKTPMKAGKQTLAWFHTAPHKTTNWRYYITKQDWNPNAPLSRDAFEKTPFCEINGFGAMPGTRVEHECDVPARTGYQLIYSVWQIADTVNSFYHVADVDFGGENTGQVETSDSWAKTLDGQIYGKDLRPGDKVKVRFFQDKSEVLSFATSLTITEELTDKNRWAKALAAAVNENANAELWGFRAGVKDARGEVEPAFGANKIYISSKAGTPDPIRKMKSIAISYEEVVSNTNERIEISSLTTSDVQKGTSTLSFNLWTVGKMSLEAKVYDRVGTVKGYTKMAVDNADQRVSFKLEGVSANEPYTLSVIGSTAEGKVIQPAPQQFTLQAAAGAETDKPASDNAKYDAIFPNNKASYKAGTLVLQPENGKVYQCKPLPYSGYCSQWSPSARQFEPGVGSSWQMAWIEK
ncbi:chitin-binding protein [Pantoea alhagi]|uniref:N-acetylglucosamine-binding protein GbpA n=1 Tax=Mixta sp. BE291 TaxID=3158787 RepID=UPI00285EE0E1|nr:chitin-binding protein [Pantoea alhagi]